MNKIMIILILMSPLTVAFGQPSKPLKEKKILVREFDREKMYEEIEKGINKIQNKQDREQLKKDIREAEMKALRKNKEIEQVFYEQNKNRPAVREFFEFKDKITTTKEINGEEFVVLKKMGHLRDQFLAERKKLFDAYNANKKDKDKMVDLNVKRENKVLYPLPAPKNSLAGSNTYTPKAHDVSFNSQESENKKLLPWIIGILLGSLASLGFYAFMKRRGPKA